MINCKYLYKQLNRTGSLLRFLTFLLLIILTLLLPSCTKEWKPGTPIAKDKIKIGVIHITDPFSESGGYSYAHQTGIEEMKQNLLLKDSQILYKTHIDDNDSLVIESAIRELIARGANIIIATSWGYMDVCEKLAAVFPQVIFAHGTGNKHNDTNFTNYFGRVYEARYLSGIVAGLQTKTNRIGYVAAWGTENSEVTGGLNAFAIGAEKANPQAKIFVKVTYSWFDPLGEAYAARALIAADCDVIAQHCDTPNPQIEAEKASADGSPVWGIGYNTDMSSDAPNAVLTSVIWRWGVYYTELVQSVINGTFTSAPYYGSIKDGIVDIAPLSGIIAEASETNGFSFMLEEERQKIESGTFSVFTGVIETNEGLYIGREGSSLSDSEIQNNINWYYRSVSVLK